MTKEGTKTQGSSYLPYTVCAHWSSSVREGWAKAEEGGKDQGVRVLQILLRSVTDNGELGKVLKASEWCGQDCSDLQRSFCILCGEWNGWMNGQGREVLWDPNIEEMVV